MHNKTLVLHPDDLDGFAFIVARVAFALDPHLDEDEIEQVVKDFIGEEYILDADNVDKLAAWVKTCKFDPEYDLWQ